MGARNREGIGLSVWRNWFFGIDSWAFKSLKFRGQISKNVKRPVLLGGGRRIPMLTRLLQNKSKSSTITIEASIKWNQTEIHCKKMGIQKGPGEES